MTLRQGIFLPFGLSVAALLLVFGVCGFPIFVLLGWMDRSDTIFRDAFECATEMPIDILRSGWEDYA